MPKRVDFPALHSVGAHVADTDVAAVHTLTPPNGALHLLIQALEQNVRYTLDGTDPTASVGFQLRAGDPPIIIIVPTNVTLKVIEETAGAVLQYQWCQ